MTLCGRCELWHKRLDLCSYHSWIHQQNNEGPPRIHQLQVENDGVTDLEAHPFPVPVSSQGGVRRNFLG